MATTRDYESVAKLCSAYEQRQSAGQASNSTGKVTVSCENCTHFDEDRYCKLDLFDPIAREHNICDCECTK